MDIEIDFSTSESSQRSTPKSIPHRRLVALAEAEPGRRLSDDAIVSGPSNKQKSQKRRHVDKQNEPEYPKRQQSLRNRGNRPLMYDSRYHPADDILRPFQAARLKERTLNGKRDCESSEASSPESHNDPSDYVVFQSSHDADEDEHETSEICPSVAARPVPRFFNSSRRRSSRNLGDRPIPNYDMRLHPDFDVHFRPSTIEAARKRRFKGRKSHTVVSAPDDHRSGIRGKDGVDFSSPDKGQKVPRKSSLSAIQSIASSKHSLRYQGALPVRDEVLDSPSIHVNTSTIPYSRSDVEPLRPSESPQIDPPQRKSGLDALFTATTVQTDDTGRVNTRNEANRATSLQSRSESQDLRRIQASDVNTLTSLERHLYLLQKGAPTKGDTLSHSWEDVEQKLRDCGDITVCSINRNSDWLKAYYENIREGVEAYWDSESEPNSSNGWTFYHVEDFNVFDGKCGVKNWRHHKDSVVHQFSNGPVFVELFEAADTEDGGVEDRSTDEDKTDLGATQVTTSPLALTEKHFSIFDDGVNRQAYDYCEDHAELTRQRAAEQSLLNNLQDQAEHPGDVNEGIEDVTKWLMFPDPDPIEDARDCSPTNENARANPVSLLGQHTNFVSTSSPQTLLGSVHPPEDTSIHYHDGTMGATRSSRRALLYRSSGLSRTSPAAAVG